MESNKLFNKHFFLLFQGQLVSQVGSSIWMVALIFWLKHTTESATVVGLISMAATLPGVLLGPLGGAIADLYSRKKIIVLGDFISGSLMLFSAGVMFFMYEATGLIIGLLFFTTLAGGIISAVFRPTVTASIPDLVPRSRIEAANGMIQASTQVSLLIGQAAGGVLFKILGAPALILIDAITYLFSALSEMFIAIPQKTSPKVKGWTKTVALFQTNIIEGFRYIQKKEGLLDFILGFAAINFFITPIPVLLPFFVEGILHSTPDWFGFLMAGFATGTILGSGFGAGIKISCRYKGRAIIILLLCFSLSLFFLGLSTSTTSALSILIFTGVCVGVTNVLMTTVIQLSTPSEFRGRVFGLIATLSGGLTPIAMGLAGIVADLVDKDITLIYLVCSLCSFLIPLLFIFRNGFHRLFHNGDGTLRKSTK